MLPLQLCAIDDEPGQVGCEKGVPLDAECEFSQLTPAHEELQLSIRNAENPCRVVAVVAGSGEHGPQEVPRPCCAGGIVRFCSMRLDQAPAI